MKTTVRIPWKDPSDSRLIWTEVCAWIVENFGLPGDRFEATISKHCLEFRFTEEKDAMLMVLMWNGHVVTDDQLAVELVEKWINR
jgi:hypothetical protein